jgi:hypothetical protein
MATKYTKWQRNILNDSKTDQMAIICTNIVHCKTFENLPPIWFAIWQPLSVSWTKKILG